MKKVIAMVAVLCVMFCLSACGSSESSSELNSEHTHIHEEITDVVAMQTMYTHFGNYNNETKENYSFSIVDTVTFNDVKYYHGRWSVLEYNEDNIRGSKLKTEFFLAADGSHLYTGKYDYEASKIVIESEKIDLCKH